MADVDAVTMQPTINENTANQTALLLSDPLQQRVMEGVTAQLGLHTHVVGEDELVGQRLFDYELIIAEQAIARRLRPLLTEQQRAERQLRPALIAVTTQQPTDAMTSDGAFDALLVFPASPADISSRLSVALYAHRSFAQRYQPSLEELDLNRSIFRSVTNGISVADARLHDMPLLYVNPAFEVITGYTLEDVRGRNCRFLQGDEHDQPALVTLRDALRQGRKISVTLRNFRRNGEPFWNELALSPIRNRHGELTHFVGIQTDVTERVEFEQALRESEKLAAVGRLASSIAHEINNPLEAVMNLVYLARVTLPPSDASASVADRSADARGFLEQAESELGRIKLITAQSLRFSKQSSRAEAVTCQELIDSVLDLYRGRLLNYHVTLEQRAHCEQPVVVMISEIRQVVSNLVANAVDAMKATGGTLRLRSRSATHWSTGRRGVTFTVADTGKGMSAETMASIYKAFFTTKGASGTGLGLWISSEIVARHRGSLHVRSSQVEGRAGTVFQLFLPYEGVASAA